jgi:amino acid transporter
MGSADQVKVEVFVRKSSGLVRPLGGGTTFLAEFMIVTGGAPIFLISLLFLAPGANWNLTYILMFIPSLALATVYTLFGIAMPRAGGDYVFVSRGLNPALGFINSFALFFAFVFSSGIYGYFGVTYLSYAFTTWGFIYNNSFLLSLGSALLTPTYLIITGIIILTTIVSIVLFTSSKKAFQVIFWLGIVTMAATIIYFTINATISPAAFTKAFNSYAGAGAYQQVINSAKANGLKFSSGLPTIMLALPISWYAYSWFTLPVTLSGEMKEVRKTLPIGLLGGLLFILAYYLIFFNISFYSFGQTFLTAWSFNYAHGISLPFAYIGTYTPFFVSLVYKNPIIPLLALLALWIPDVNGVTTYSSATRYLFAWSFDRMAPDVFNRVNPRTKVPVISALATALIGFAGLVGYAFVPAFTLIDALPLLMFGYILPVITAIIFPFLKKEMYNNSFVIKRKILKIPILSWVGIIALVGIIYGLIGLWNSYLMPINLVTIMLIVLVYVAAGLIFLAMYLINRRKGINPLYAYKEVPPE